MDYVFLRDVATIGGVMLIGIFFFWLNKRRTVRKRTLEDYGYKFTSAGRLCKIVDESKGFTFVNQKHYDEIGELVAEFVYLELQQKCKMVQLPVPIESPPDSTFIFASRDYQEREKLIILLHGSGAVRAGQWSRRLIINDGMHSGSQIPYIQRAMTLGYAVLVLNPNDNSRNGRPIKGSEGPVQHARYVWEKYIKGAKARRIAIVAHSGGRGLISCLINAFKEDFYERVLAIAFTAASVENYPADFIDFGKRSRNWIQSQSPLGTQIPSTGLLCFSAGTTTHEETSHKAIDEVFNFIKEQMRVRNVTVKLSLTIALPRDSNDNHCQRQNQQNEENLRKHEAEVRKDAELRLRKK